MNRLPEALIPSELLAQVLLEIAPHLSEGASLLYPADKDHMQLYYRSIETFTQKVDRTTIRLFSIIPLLRRKFSQCIEVFPYLAEQKQTLPSSIKVRTLALQFHKTN